ncbi:MAG: DUF362 domain-containing protein [Christensenellales bacterium]|jgi:uncharacterized protein (DUF362 family)/Pyruvate/2-oxoacid:ferredoxin oxidoreductase delta subunit
MKVALKRCDEYSIDDISKALDEAIKLLGGMEQFAGAGERVLVKPNLLMPCSPEKAATTHPEVVRAVLRLVKSAGAQAVIGECPGGIFSPSYLKLVYSQCGITKVAREEGCEIIFDFTETAVEQPLAVIEKWPIIASFYREYDRIINIAKLKTHGFMGYSGAVKNMFGAVPGVHKAQYHLKYPEKSDFAAAIVDIYEAVRPSLCIVDGIIAMEGDGPSGGVPRKIGALVAGGNGHGVDLACAKMVGIDPASLPILNEALARGLLQRDELKVLGDEFAPLKDFLPPKNLKSDMSFSSGALMRLIGKVSKSYPKFIYAKCTGCAICARNCPPKAITMSAVAKFSGKRPFLDKKLCINCLCCHELCPSLAIDIKRFMNMKV